MIDSTSLTLGNMVMHNGEEITVNSINTGGINYEKYYSDVDWISEDDLQPIALTPEWLERCDIKSLKGFTISKSGQHFAAYKYGVFLCQVKYLHQLQNLANSIYHTELNINL